jgi:hypothetical protein
MQQGRMWALIGTMTAACACVGQPWAHAKDQHQQAADSVAALESGPVDGQSLGAWTTKWWHWAFSQSVEPYLDPDGRLCELGQEGPVWFLAGTDGTFRPKRECVVPEGKYLMVPVINMIYMQQAGTPNAASCEELQAEVAVNNDSLRSAVAMLDGKPLGDLKLRRVRSDGCFRLDQEDPRSRLAAADGYWLMIKPLSRGRHTLVVGANYGASHAAYGDMNQNFEYVLDVGGKALMSERGNMGPDTFSVAYLGPSPRPHRP